MNDWMKDVKYYLMPASHPVKGYEEQYLKTYLAWRGAWEKFRTEIGVHHPLNSDGFVVPDELGAVFYKGECVGLSAFTYGSLSEGPMSSLGWYNGWSEMAFQKLKNLSHNSMIGSQFTVANEFAGKNQVTRWREIIFNYTFMRFEASSADVMAGQLNVSRKIHDSAGESFGATVLEANKIFDYYGVNIPAQFVAYEKHNIHRMLESRNADGLCDDLFDRIVHLTDYPLNRNVLPLKKLA